MLKRKDTYGSLKKPLFGLNDASRKFLAKGKESILTDWVEKVRR